MWSKELRKRKRLDSSTAGGNSSVSSVNTSSVSSVTTSTTNRHSSQFSASNVNTANLLNLNGLEQARSQLFNNGAVVVTNGNVVKPSESDSRLSTSQSTNNSTSLITGL